MNHSLSVPQLPGYRKKEASPTKRVLDFGFVNGYSVQRSPLARHAKNVIKSSASLSSLPTLRTETNTSPQSFTPSPSGLSSPPSWLAHDRQVLLFYAYFKEGVIESSDENHRIRKCEIFYYLVDDSMHVAEPKVINSGIPQGIFMKRHKVPKEGNEGKFYTLDDLYIGAEISLYGRTFYICGCNGSTKKRMTEMGYHLADDIDYPQDKYTLSKKKAMELSGQGENLAYRGVKMNDTKAFVEASLGRLLRDGDTIERYLKDDRKVLRFDCAWDCRDRLYGSMIFYTFHYFVADDTIEILEKHTRNSGSAAWPRLLNRGILPKPGTALAAEGSPKKRRGNDTSEIYTWRDFFIGASVTCYGRNLILTDCDGFTREFYEFKAIDLGDAINLSIPEKVVERAPPPPHNGIGSEEDSLGSCKMLVPKPPKKDIAKLLDMERKILRFAAVFTDPMPEDKNRQFLINYFLADNTLSVGEPPIRNSGITGGKFLKRGKYTKGSDTVFVKAADFQIGKAVNILTHSFKITDADEYTIRYIENNPTEFPVHSNVVSIIMKLTTKLRKEKFSLGKAFRLVDTNHSGFICLSELKSLLAQYFTSSEVSPTELLTIMRFFDEDGKGLVTIHDFVRKLNETDVKLSSQEIGGESNCLKIPYVEEDYLDKCLKSNAVDMGQFYKDRVLFSFAHTLKNRGIGLLKLFNVFDKDGSGILEKDEFRSILKNSNVIPGNMPEEQINTLCDHFLGGNEILNLKEFRNKVHEVLTDFERKEMSRKLGNNIALK